MTDRRSALVGRTFWHPVLDYMLIGGGLSIFFAGVIYGFGDGPNRGVLFPAPWVLGIALFSVSAHFGASTVRLYSKPDARESLAFVTLGLPLVAIALTTLIIVFSGTIGYHYRALYFTWAPYHYAAQTYGLAVMYSMRSGCRLDAKMKKAVRAAALLPVVYTFAFGRDEGLGWILSLVHVIDTGQVAVDGALADALRLVLQVGTFVAPLVLFAHVWRDKGRPLPLIVPTLLVANGLWWVFLPAVQAFVWATIFHSVQYLAIVLIFHVRDQPQQAQPKTLEGPWPRAIKFYALSLALGYALFYAVPEGYMALGFGEVESALIVVASVNLHHYIVDAFVWRLDGDRRNRRIVDGER